MAAVSTVGAGAAIISYNDEICKICRLQNGWEIEIYQPTPAEEKEEEDAEKKGMPISYDDPWRGFAFSTIEEVIAFITKKLPELKPRNYDEDYEAAFNKEAEKLSKGNKK